MTKKKKALTLRIFSAFLTLCCLATCLVFSPVVSADDNTLQDYQKQLDNLDKQIAENQKKLNEINSEKKTNQTQYNKLSSEIDSINNEIDLLDNKVNVLNNNISALQSSITTTSNDIETITQEIELIKVQVTEANALMADTRELLLGRIRENYMAGEGSALEILFNSNDIATYFAKKELMNRVSEEDAALINELTGKVTELNALQTELTNQIATLENKKTELSSEIDTLADREEDLQSSLDAQKDKKSTVTSKQQELSKVINELNKDSAEYKTAIKKQEAEREKLNAQIDEYIKAHASSTGDTPDASIVNDGNMAWPVKGSTKITAGYPAYSDGTSHWGIDIVKTDGTTRGSAFCAAQGGKVIIAVNDGGWNYGFGNYCVIDHGDGKMTLYAHSDNIQCYVGQIVTKGQQIGIIGATGNVTGPHLHFEVRIKNADGSVSRVNPLNYVSKP